MHTHEAFRPPCCVADKESHNVISEICCYALHVYTKQSLQTARSFPININNIHTWLFIEHSAFLNLRDYKT